MKIKFIYLLVSFFLLTSFKVDNSLQMEGPRDCFTANNTFINNEKLRFDVYYNWNFIWARAGYVDFSAKETTYAGTPSYLFKATGKTLKTYDPIFKVRDYYQSYVERETMKPLKYLRNINEGGYTKYEELRFNYGSKTISSKTGKTKKEAESQSFPLSNCTYDIVSIMYHLRTMDLDSYKVGDKIPINIFFDEEQYDLYVKYLGVEEIKVRKQGMFKTHKVSPLLIKGNVFTETDKMFVYVTADENKLPVLIESPIKVGSIKAVISNAKNLKYPIEAKL